MLRHNNEGLELSDLGPVLADQVFFNALLSSGEVEKVFQIVDSVTCGNLSHVFM